MTASALGVPSSLGDDSEERAPRAVGSEVEGRVTDRGLHVARAQDILASDTLGTFTDCEPA